MLVSAVDTADYLYECRDIEVHYLNVRHVEIHDPAFLSEATDMHDFQLATDTSTIALYTIEPWEGALDDIKGLIKQFEASVGLPVHHYTVVPKYIEREGVMHFWHYSLSFAVVQPSGVVTALTDIMSVEGVDISSTYHMTYQIEPLSAPLCSSCFNPTMILSTSYSSWSEIGRVRNLDGTYSVHWERIVTRHWQCQIPSCRRTGTTSVAERVWRNSLLGRP